MNIQSNGIAGFDDWHERRTKQDYEKYGITRDFSKYDSALKDIIGVVTALPPAPCDGCYMAKWCKSLSLACSQFESYTNSEPVDDGLRFPSKMLYIKLFGDPTIPKVDSEPDYVL